VTASSNARRQHAAAQPRVNPPRPSMRSASAEMRTAACFSEAEGSRKGTASRYSEAGSAAAKRKRSRDERQEEGSFREKS